MNILLLHKTLGWGGGAKGPFALLLETLGGGATVPPAPPVPILLQIT